MSRNTLYAPPVRFRGRAVATRAPGEHSDSKVRYSPIGALRSIISLEASLSRCRPIVSGLVSDARSKMESGPHSWPSDLDGDALNTKARLTVATGGTQANRGRHTIVDCAIECLLYAFWLINESLQPKVTVHACAPSANLSPHVLPREGTKRPVCPAAPVITGHGASTEKLPTRALASAASEGPKSPSHMAFAPSNKPPVRSCVNALSKRYGASPTSSKPDAVILRHRCHRCT